MAPNIKNLEQSVKKQTDKQQKWVFFKWAKWKSEKSWWREAGSQYQVARTKAGELSHEKNALCSFASNDGDCKIRCRIQKRKQLKTSFFFYRQLISGEQSFWERQEWTVDGFRRDCSSADIEIFTYCPVIVNMINWSWWFGMIRQSSNQKADY